MQTLPHISRRVHFPPRRPDCVRTPQEFLRCRCSTTARRPPNLRPKLGDRLSVSGIPSTHKLRLILRAGDAKRAFPHTASPAANLTRILQRAPGDDPSRFSFLRCRSEQIVPTRCGSINVSPASCTVTTVLTGATVNVTWYSAGIVDELPRPRQTQQTPPAAPPRDKAQRQSRTVSVPCSSVMKTYETG